MHEYVQRANESPRRFLFLTVSLFVLILVRSFIPESAVHGFILDALFLCIFIGGLLAIRGTHWDFWVTLGFSGFAFIGGLIEHFVELEGFQVAVKISLILFLLLSLRTLLIYIFEEIGRVNIGVISVAVTGYLLLGILWGVVYELVTIIYLDAFSGIGIGSMSSDFQYFSFVTLSTLGYGDIIPVIRSARSLAMLEAISGQLYLAILISQLIGAHVARSQRNPH